MSALNPLSMAEFQSAIPPEYQEFVLNAHNALTNGGYKPKFQLRRYGMTAQYTSPVTKRLALQFFMRENALHMYLYSGFIYRCDGFLDDLPPCIFKELEAHNNCKDCTPECCEKSSCTIGGKLYDKCLCARMLFTVDEEVTGILPVLQKICAGV